MNKIYLNRHGQNEDNFNGILNGHRDLPLTELGIQQAIQLGDHIQASGLKFDKIYSSPLKRAFDTALVVAKKLGMEKPEKLDLLIERDFGVMTGIPASEIETRCAPDIIKTNTITYFLSPEKSETFPDLIKRAQTLLDFIDSKHKNESILLSGHGDMGKMIYTAFYEENWKDILCNFHFGNCELLLLDKECPPNKRHLIKIDQFNH